MRIRVLFSQRVVPFFKELWNRFFENDALGIAAQLAYYLLFSIFPLFVFLVALVPLLARVLPIKDAVLGAFDNLSTIMPKDALAPIRHQFTELVDKTRPNLISFGLIVALWSASRATDAFRAALNRAYQLKESRSFVKQQGIAILLTILLALFVVGGFSAIIVGGKLSEWISQHTGIPRALFSWLRWPVSTLFVMVSIGLCYRILPDRKLTLRQIAPGAVMSTGLWILFAWLFTKYAEHFGDYNVTYGSIGSVIVLMTWLYLSGLIFLLGGEINATLQGDAKKQSPAHTIEKIRKEEKHVVGSQKVTP